MMRRAIAVLLIAATTAHAAPKFTKGPTVARKGAGATVAFTVSESTDVAVYVLDKTGRVVRHLAAGAIGAGAQHAVPLQKGLAQSIVWDGKDDSGKQVYGAPPATAEPSGGAGFKVRVALGLKPQFSHFIGDDPQARGGICGMGSNDKGELFLMYKYGGLSHHYLSMAIKVFGRDGRYLRTVMPYPANLPDEQRAGVKSVTMSDPSTGSGQVGRKVPLVLHGHSRGLYPETGATFRQSIVFRPDGRMVTSAAPFDAPSGIKHRRLLTVGADGSVGADYLGPRILPAIPKAGGWVELAISPDGKTVYLSGHRIRYKGPHSAVYKTTWDNAGPPTLFAGNPAKPGNGPAEFNEPRGIDVDKDGNVYVCDHRNNRVSVFTPDGKPLAQLPAKSADLVKVHPKTGAVYVLCTASKSKWPVSNWGSGANFNEKMLFKFDSYKATTPSLTLDLSKYRTARPMMTLDASAEQPVLWVTGLKWGDGRIYQIVDDGKQLKMSPGPIASFRSQGGVGTGWLDVTVDRRTDEVIVGNSSRKSVGVKRFDGLTGKYLGRLQFSNSRELGSARGNWGESALSWDGKYIFYATPLEKHWRYDRTGKMAPWPATEKGRLEPIPQGFIHPRGHAPTPDGGLMMLHHPKHRIFGSGAVTYVDANGKIAKPSFITLDVPVGGIKVDGAGNIYVGVSLRPAKARMPAWFKGRIPKAQQPWYEHMYGSIIKFGPNGGKVAAGAGGYAGGPSRKSMKIDGAKWVWYGVSPQPSRKVTKCSCQTPRFDVDAFGRVWIPDAFGFRVIVIDSSGRTIAQFGNYGNGDSGREGGIDTPAIPFGWVHSVQVTDRAAYIPDVVNHRVVAAKLSYVAEATCAIK
jgi:DNA-binding beta-propeller fold protein YncE